MMVMMINKHLWMRQLTHLFVELLFQPVLIWIIISHGI